MKSLTYDFRTDFLNGFLSKNLNFLLENVNLFHENLNFLYENLGFNL